MELHMSLDSDSLRQTNLSEEYSMDRSDSLEKSIQMRRRSAAARGSNLSNLQEEVEYSEALETHRSVRLEHHR